MANSIAVYASPGRDYHVYIFVNVQMRQFLQPWIGEGVRALASLRVYVHILDADTTNPFVNAFRTCATERLRLPLALPDLDAIIYADVDTLWRMDPAELWQWFGRFTEEQSMGMSVAMERNQSTPRTQQPWVVEAFNRQLPWRVNGLNTGVLLWNLTRARRDGDRDSLLATLRLLRHNYSKFFLFGDQDALNYLANRNPQRFFVLPCKYNLRMVSMCEHEPRVSDALILHGNMGLFHQGRLCVGGHDYRGLFQAVYRWNVSRNFSWPRCCSPLPGVRWPPAAAQPQIKNGSKELEPCKPQEKACCRR